MPNDNRVPAGVPTGGEWTAKQRGDGEDLQATATTVLPDGFKVLPGTVNDDWYTPETVKRLQTIREAGIPNLVVFSHDPDTFDWKAASELPNGRYLVFATSQDSPFTTVYVAARPTDAPATDISDDRYDEEIADRVEQALFEDAVIQEVERRYPYLRVQVDNAHAGDHSVIKVGGPNPDDQPLTLTHDERGWSPSWPVGSMEAIERAAGVPADEVLSAIESVNTDSDMVWAARHRW